MSTIDDLSTRLTTSNPWTSVYGLGRSLLALCTFLTLATNNPDLLFRRAVGQGSDVRCDYVAGKISAFCIVPHHDLIWIQIAACVGLLVVASGWRPRITAVLHWYIAFSYYNSAVNSDGGDQVTATLSFLLLPLALSDPRKWHWLDMHALPAEHLRLFGNVAALLIQFQVAVIYFDACIAKFSVPEWSNGTILYYVMNNNYFGASSVLSWITNDLFRTPFVVVVTWSSLTLEFFLGIDIFLSDSARRLLFWFGLAFHAAIGLFIGIPTFGIAMMGALLLGVVPIGSTISDVLPFGSSASAGRRLASANSS